MKVRLVWGASRVTKMLTLLSAASLCTCIVGARAARAEGEQREPAVTISELEQRLEAIRKESGIPGVSVAIVRRHGVEWAGGLGVAIVATAQPATADTLFRMGSISKGFVALAVLQLVHEGRLSLEDRVRSLVPMVKFENPWENTHPVVVADLLEHTTGWEDLSLREFAFSTPGISLEESLDFDPKSRVSRWKPGTRMSYSSSGPAVAAYIVEQLSGMPFEEYARTRLFAPLQMSTATFYEPQDLAGATELYHRDKVTPYPYWHGLYRASGSLNASARDMGAYLLFYLGRGRVGQAQVLPEALLERMERGKRSWYSQTGNPPVDGLGSGSSVRDGFIYRGHAGGVPGGLALAEYLPDLGSAYAYAINTNDHAAYERLGNEIRAYLTRGEARLSISPRQVPPPDAADYTGWYEPAAPRWTRNALLESLLGQRRLSWNDGMLRLSDLFGNEMSFVPTSNHGLRFVAETGAEVPIATSALLPPNEEGRFVYFEGWHWYRRIPMGVVAARVSLTILSLIVIVTLLCLAPFFWFRHPKRGRHVRMTERRLLCWPVVAIVSLLFVVSTALPLWEDPIEVFGKPTFWSVGFFVASLVLAAASLGSVAVWVAHRRHPAGGFVRGLTLATSLALVVVTGYLGYYGLIGMRSWA